jgi:DNA-binding response OmpR family regulator
MPSRWGHDGPGMPVSNVRAMQASPETQAPILLIDPDERFARRLERMLAGVGYRVLHVSTLPEAVRLMTCASWQLIISELVLPGCAGPTLCHLVRTERHVPLLLLSEHADEQAIIAALDAGADDVLPKPLATGEFLARVRALLWRYEQTFAGRQLLSSAGLQVDLAARQVFRGPREVILSQKEFNLLVCLMQHAGQALSRPFLLEHVWGTDFGGAVRTVDTHIRWLREKLEQDPMRPNYIQTVRQVGYRYSEPMSRPCERDALVFFQVPRPDR